MQVEIQKNVPLPQRTKLPRYPLEDMDIGDSFLSGIPADDKRKTQTLRTTICRAQRSMDGKRFSVVQDPERNEMRVFRVA